MARDILKSLKHGFVLGDGGYLEEAKFRGYSTPRVIVEFPEALRLIHQDFFRAGSQVLQALTWWTTRKYLKERGEGQGWENRVEEINRTAVRLAKQVAGDEALVAGCLCASDYGPHVFDPNDRAMCDRARAGWDEQIAVMVEEGGGPVHLRGIPLAGRSSNGTGVLQEDRDSHDGNREQW